MTAENERMILCALQPIPVSRWAEVRHDLENIQGRENPIRTEAGSALIEPRTVAPFLWRPHPAS